ncbi:heterokaryon incompatibility protein-domain-containing protein [Phaeosphaeriaceae sp. PMI808]|nr:heterokaryon incompatibility protein-domain-containing protein [Phaeosphaeriaceae sp. PMI808]
MVLTKSTEAQTDEVRCPWAETRLDTTQACIRILRLHPGSQDTPITCDLEAIYLDRDPYYEALSYVWGDPSKTKPITVGSSTFNATANLHGFLVALRHESEERLLWADAICIDQSSAEEKSYQIGLMTRIYREAKKSHIWFGPFDKKSWFNELIDEQYYRSTAELGRADWNGVDRAAKEDLNYFKNQRGFKPLNEKEHSDFVTRCKDDIFLHTIDFLTKIADSKDHLYTYPIFFIQKQADGSEKYEANRAWLVLIDCMQWLMSRPWWTRVWTLQEAVLPRVDPIVHAPPYSFKLSQLLNGVHQMDRHVRSACCKWFGGPVFTTYRVNSDRSVQLVKIYTQREKLKTNKEEWISLEHVIDSVQGRTATEIRDHWFGIFGFMPPAWQEADRRMQAETWTTEEIFMKCTKLLYSDSEDLTKIAMSKSQRESNVARLPSWVIDLSKPQPDQNEYRRWMLYNASRGSKYEGIRLWKDTRTPNLSVKGQRMGRVSACGDSAPLSVLQGSGASENARKLLVDWKKLYDERAPYPDDNAFWRTIFMDTDIWIHYMSPRRGILKQQRVDAIKSWWRNWNRTKDEHDLELDEKTGLKERGRYHYRALKRNLDPAKFFVTSKGVPGMGPHDMEPSDEIYLLAGCRALAVLREVEIDGKKCLTFVGLCFLDKQMHGSAVQGESNWQSLELF